MKRLLPLIVGALLVAGCGTQTEHVPFVSPESAPPPSSAPAPVADPTAITIPAIDAHSTLAPLGLTVAGELAVPPVDQPGQASWYAGAKPDVPGDEFQPGERGPAVIAGHVDGVINGRKGQPGIFFRLHELTPGAEILIDRADGSQVRFLVDRVAKFPKAKFPTDEVYGPTPVPTLRLITCGGAFDRGAGHYTDNWIVWASIAP